jgi:hypothetical protein
MDRLPLNPTRLSITLYRALLVIYPPSHRRAYGPLMVQLFHDLCRDEVARGGLFGLLGLWVRTLADLITSASAAHLQAAKGLIMSVNRSLKPMPWGRVMLVVVPGILFGLSRFYYPVGPLAMIGFALVIVLTLAALAVRRRLPIWGLLVLGLAANWIALWIGLLAMDDLAVRLRAAHGTLHLILAIPLWAVIILLAWRYKHIWRAPAWTLALFALIVGGASVWAGYGVLTTAGMMLLPVALGLSLSERYGSLTSLFVVGAYGLWLFDSDFISGYMLRDASFYPVYALLVSWLFIGVAPLLLLRARSQRGRVIGLLAPIVVVLIARVVVPWLAHPELHPLRIWLGDTLLSVFTLLILALSFILYSQAGGSEPSAAPSETGHPAFAG